MNERGGDGHGWSDADWNLLIDAIDRLDRAWRESANPRVGDFVPVAEDDPRFDSMLQELLRADRECRDRYGEPESTDEITPRPNGDPPPSNNSVAAHDPLPLRILCRGQGCPERIDLVSDEAATKIQCPRCGHEFLVGDTGLPTEKPSDGTRRVRRFVGDFRIDVQLGVGAFGAVWRALQIPLDRHVAIKIPHVERLDEQRVKRFEREATAAGKLDHPNVVRVFTHLEDDELLGIVYEFIDGVPLDQWQADRPQTARATASLYAQIADGVDHAHQNDVIHRDLKPQNVLIDAKDRPHVADFGLARLDTDAAGRQTTEGTLLGTPAYMSPEQASGHSHQADHRSDIYSLGVMLFESLTGELPFRGTKRAVLAQHVEQEPPRLRRINPDVPRDLETICLKCLEKEPRRRYPTAAALSAELRRYLNGEPIHARPPSPPERLWRWCRRNPTVAALFATVAAAAIVTAALAVQWRGAARQAREQQAKAEGFLHALRSGYPAKLEGARASLDDGDLISAERLLQACDPRFRDWEHHFLSACLHEKGAVVAASAAEVYCVAVAQQADRVYFGCADGTLGVWDAETRTTKRVSVHDGIVSAVAVSADGGIVVTGGWDRTVRLTDTDTGQTGKAIGTHDAAVSAVAVLRDGSSIVSASRDGIVKLWQLDADAPTHEIAAHDAAITGVAVTADGTRLVSAAQDGSLKLWNATTGEIVFTLAGHERAITAVAFDPDDRQVISAGDDAAVKTWDAQTGEVIYSTTTPLPASTVAFGGDGQQFAIGYYDGTIEVRNTSTDEYVERLVGHTSVVAGIAFASRPDRLFSAGWDGVVRRWSFDANVHGRVLHSHADQVECVAISSPLPASGDNDDTVVLASGGNDDTVLLRRLSESDPFARLRVENGPVSSLDFQPTGTLLAVGSFDGSVTVWDVSRTPPATTERTLKKAGSGAVFGVAFSPNGAELAVARRDGVLAVLDVPTGDVKAELQLPATLSSVAFTPDGRHTVCGSWDGTVRIWNKANASKARTIVAHDMAVSSVAISPDGRMMATGSEDSTTCLWHFPSCELIVALQGHLSGVTSVRFNPAGNRVVTAGEDKTIRIWNAVTGQQLLAITGHLHTVADVALSTDGKLLASASLDHDVRLWDGTGGERLPEPVVGLESGGALAPFVERFDTGAPGWLGGAKLGWYANDDDPYYRWDSESRSLYVQQPNKNIDGDDHCFFRRINYQGGSFRLQFDVVVEDHQYDATLAFGMSTRPNDAWDLARDRSFLRGLFSRTDAGPNVAIGAASHATTNQWGAMDASELNGRRVRFCFDYDRESLALRTTVTETKPGGPVTILDQSTVLDRPFSAEMDYLVLSDNRSHRFPSTPNKTFGIGYLDNIRFEQQPAAAE